MITLNESYTQTKRVVDPNIGAYETVLSINPTAGLSGIVGTYNCTVENAKGKSSKSIIGEILNHCTYVCRYWSSRV